MKQIIELKKQDTCQLNKELSQLFREQFNLKMQSSSGKLKQSHLLRKVRRKIAQIKTLLTEKNG